MTWQRPGRWWRHAITDRADVRRAFSEATLDRIEQAIGAAEGKHAGQIVFAIEPALPFSRVSAKLSPRDRAMEVFGLLRVWDTEHNNGVLVYLLMADRDVEIVADRGIHARVGEAMWQHVCETMEAAFREGRYEEGALAGVEAVSSLLAKAFPRSAGSTELPNRPVVI